MSLKSLSRWAALASCAAVLLAACAGVARAQSSGWSGGRQGVPGKDLNAVYFLDSKRGWVAGDGGLVLHTRDAGRTWSRQTVETKESFNDVYFRNEEDGYLLAASQIFTTDDGGESWRPAARFTALTFGAEPELYSVRFTSKKRGWIVGSLSRGESVIDSLVLSTDNGGASWQRQRVPVRDELIHLDFDGDRRGWVVGSGGRILYTRDGGETWDVQNSGTSAALYHVDFEGDERGWAVGERGTILRTEDGGHTWRAVPPPVRTTLLSVKFLNKEEGWAVGRGGVILRTADGGSTWVQQETNTRQHLYALFFDKKAGWAVGADGLVLRYER
ncbi:MAG TPA: YCF48-related protein [Pyrinomonadaceae bacterium]